MIQDTMKRTLTLPSGSSEWELTTSSVTLRVAMRKHRDDTWSVSFAIVDQEYATGFLPWESCLRNEDDAWVAVTDLYKTMRGRGWAHWTGQHFQGF